MKRPGLLFAAPFCIVAMLLFVGGAASGSDDAILVIHNAALGKLHPGALTTEVVQKGRKTTVTKQMPFLSAGTLRVALDELKEEEADAGPSDDLIGMAPNSNGCSARNLGKNVRVNQDCTFRRQAEEDIVANPTDATNLLAGQNDSRVGFNQCGIDWSVDSGVHWGDLLPPFRQHLNAPEGAGSHTIQGNTGTGHTYDAASDPTLAYDAAGNAYFGCVAFDVLDNASMIFVTQSPAIAKGSFFFNIPATGSRYIVTEDNSGPGHTEVVFHDKEFIAADFYATSPNKNNVYITWTLFEFANPCGGPHPSGGYCESPVYGSMSTDGAKTWSPPEIVSGTSSQFCQFGNFFRQTLNKNACNFNQGSDPTVLPNGDLFVVWNNGNTPGLVNQQLGVLCHPTGKSTDGTAHLNCTGDITKVGNDVIAGEPQCDFGRGPEECIPGAYIRTNDFPRISTNAQNGHLYVVWQDYRNDEFDIQMSQSTDGGKTWSAEKTVNRDDGLDHYFAAVDQSQSIGDRVGVSYYRTARVPNENAAGPSFTGSGIFAPCGQGGAIPTGATSCAGVGAQNSDYVLAGGTGMALPYPYVVLSPIFPPPDGIQIGFNGDYSGLIIATGTQAHPVWSDTRNAAVAGNGVAHDEDIFSDNIGLPSGTATRTTGTIGQ